MQIKQHGNVRQINQCHPIIIHYNGSTITRVPLHVLSIELSMTFLLQTSIFVCNFYSGVNFCGKKNCGYFILREFIFEDREKPARIAKTTTTRTKTRVVLAGTEELRCQKFGTA